MRLVSPLLKRIVYPSLAGLGYLNAHARHGLAVITYHGVLPPGYAPIDAAFDGSLITAQTFRQQLRLLKLKYTVISPEQMLSWSRREWELPPRAALVTCDDGFLNNLTEMLPILEEEGVKAIFFVTGASAGQRRTMLWHEEVLLMFLRAPAGSFELNVAGVELGGLLGSVEQRRTVWWQTVKHLSQVEAESREKFLCEAHAHFGLERSLDYYLANYPEAQRHFCLLTRAEVERLAAAGMTIGAHSLTHPILTQLPPKLAWAEIVESRTLLESVIRRSIWAFAYPYGDAGSVSPEIVTMAEQAGFETAFVNVGGGLGAELPLHAIPRVHVNAGMNLSEFEAHVSGFYESLQRSLGRNRQPNLSAVESARSLPFPGTPISRPKTA